MNRKLFFITLWSFIIMAFSVFSVGCANNDDKKTDENPKQTETISQQTETVHYELLFDDFSLIKGQTVSLDAKLLVDGSLKNGNILYSSGDDSVISLNGASATANNFGTTTITATAVLNDDKTITKIANCEVTSDSGIVTDRHFYKVYVSDSVLGEPFDKQTTIVTDVYIGGVKSEDANVAWSCADSSVASVSSDGHIQAVKVGKTYAIGTFTSSQTGELKTVPIVIEVAIPVVSTNKNVVVDISESFCFIDAINIIGNGKSVGKICDVKTGKIYPAVNGKINTDGLKVGEYRFIIYDNYDLSGCEVNLIVADYVINNKTDFLNIGSKYSSKYIAVNTDLDNVGSYKNEIIGTFSGVFNGLGHKINGVTLDSDATGLFSYAGNGATFKNLSVSGLKINASNAGLFFFRSSGIIHIDNIFIESTCSYNVSLSGSLYGFAFTGKVYISNTIIVGYDYNLTNYKSVGALCGRTKYLPQISNLYIISDGYICSQLRERNSNGATLTLQNDACYTLNDYPILFRTLGEFSEEKNSTPSSIDLSGFDPNIWDLNAEFPCFK